MEFIAEIELEKIPSVNKLYSIGRTRQGKMYVYKNANVKKFQKEFLEKASGTNLCEINDYNVFEAKVHMTFIFKRRFWVRDVSNCIKAIEDSLQKVTGFDDRRTTTFIAEKIKGEDNRERIITRIELIEYEPKSEAD